MQKDRVQVLNPRTGRWVKIDTKKGGIVHHKESPGPFKNVKKVVKKKMMTPPSETIKRLREKNLSDYDEKIVFDGPEGGNDDG